MREASLRGELPSSMVSEIMNFYWLVTGNLRSLSAVQGRPSDRFKKHSLGLVSAHCPQEAPTP